MSRRFAVLVNPLSAGGRALRRLPAVTAELDRLGVSYRAVETTSLAHACEETRAAAAAGETVATLGGDGIVRPVAGELRNTGAALAIIPGGRGNDFARVLGIPDEPEAAVRVAVEGEERLLDMAEVNGAAYIGIASFGFDSVANKLANDAKLVRGNLVYLYAALRALVTYKPARFTVTVDGERHEFVRGHSIAVANSKAYGGGMFLAPHAVLDDGELDVVAIADASRRRLLIDIPKVFKGAHLDSPKVHTYRGKEIELEADREFDIYADGDPVARTPATASVQARCLRVIVPR